MGQEPRTEDAIAAAEVNEVVGGWSRGQEGPLRGPGVPEVQRDTAFGRDSAVCYSVVH